MVFSEEVNVDENGSFLLGADFTDNGGGGVHPQTV